MKRILAIDPGDVETAYAEYDPETRKLVSYAIINNERELLGLVRKFATPGYELAVEMIASYGMPVGRNVFDTCVWIGRIIECWKAATGITPRLITRSNVKKHLCHDSRAKDKNVSQAIANRYGGDPRRAKGTKKAPGPLYGVAEDIWAAIAVAFTAAETNVNYLVGTADIGVDEDGPAAPATAAPETPVT